MKFIYTGEVKVGMGKLDQFMEFANRLGVNGVEQTQNVPGKKKRKKRYKSLSSKRQECDKKLNVESDQMENEICISTVIHYSSFSDNS